MAHEGESYDYGGNELSIGGVECETCEHEDWATVDGKRAHEMWRTCRARSPTGVALRNRFEALVELEDREEVNSITMGADAVGSVGALEVLPPEKTIGGVGSTGRLRPAGKGKVTIDSGAAESVMPRGMLQREPLVEGDAKKAGVRYVAANGSKMDNYGEKRVRFKREGFNGVNSLLFQVTDVGKPRASVSRILDKGNAVIFSRGLGGSYVINDKTGQRIPLVEEKGTFVMEVEYLEPDVEMEDFARQGS